MSVYSCVSFDSSPPPWYLSLIFFSTILGINVRQSGSDGRQKGNRDFHSKDSARKMWEYQFLPRFTIGCFFKWLRKKKSGDLWSFWYIFSRWFWKSRSRRQKTTLSSSFRHFRLTLPLILWRYHSRKYISWQNAIPQDKTILFDWYLYFKKVNIVSPTHKGLEI